MIEIVDYDVPGEKIETDRPALERFRQLCNHAAVFIPRVQGLLAFDPQGSIQLGALQLMHAVFSHRFSAPVVEAMNAMSRRAGLEEFGTVCLTLPRRSGKTTLISMLMQAAAENDVRFCTIVYNNRMLQHLQSLLRRASRDDLTPHVYTSTSIRAARVDPEIIFIDEAVSTQAEDYYYDLPNLKFVLQLYTYTQYLPA